MLGKNSRPVIGKLITGNRAGFIDVATSPRSPLDFKIQSPSGIRKHYDAGGGVGLGIVAALEKSGEGGGSVEIQAKKTLCSRNMNRSDPIPVTIAAAKNSTRRSRVGGEGNEEMDMDSEEDYTYVTYHRPSNKSYTSRVYCDHGFEYTSSRTGHQRADGRNTKSVQQCTFDISPARFGDIVTTAAAYPTSDFLSSCHLCHKKLHGKDIYMYRGDKAFCSTECRYRQISMDERKEKCSSEASRSSAHRDISTSSSSSPGQLFSTGILAI